MPYDKYRNWSTEPDHTVPRLAKSRDIKEQVAIDFLEAKDQTERLEILDSFQAYVERCYRRSLVLDLSHLLLSKLDKPLAGALETFVGEPYLSPRARMVAREEQKEAQREGDSTGHTR